MALPDPSLPLTTAQTRALAAFLIWQGRTALSVALHRARKGRGLVLTLELDGPLRDGDIRRALGEGACWLGCWVPPRGPDHRVRCGVRLLPSLQLEILCSPPPPPTGA